MTRKRTSRTVWRLPLGLTPMQHAQYQASTLTTAEWVSRMTPIQAAVDLLAAGDWKTSNWSPLFDALNHIEALLKLKHVPDHGLIDDAQAVFVAALDRQEKTKATAFWASEIATLREVVKVYGDLLREATHRDIQLATDNVKANIKRIMSQKGPNVADVGHCFIERKAA